MKANKKVLIITYYWPPAGGPGVQRWLKFSKYLPEFGWEPTVYIPENPSYPLVDETLLNEVPNNIKIIKRKIWEPYQWAEKLNKKNKKFKAGQFDVGKNQSWKSKLSIWVRGNFFIPDARVFWVKPSVDFLKKYLEKHHYDVIISTGPPHSVHLIGLGLKNKFPQLKWVADFRDPWTEISYYQHLKLTKKSDKKHKLLESLVFKNADITLATSYSDADNFQKKGANAFCITNGFDTEVQTTSVHQFDKFTLAYIGVLEQLRNPEILWKSLEELLVENPELKHNFELKFVGKLDDKILSSFNETQLKNVLNYVGYLSHKESVLEMQNSNILLITNFPKKASVGIIPGKLFEYLATGNTLLSFGPQGADVEKILKETQAGKHFDYESQSESIKEFILNKYNDWKENRNQNNFTNIEKFSRKNLSHQLSELLQSL